jgi:CBS domain-containing protein
MKAVVTAADTCTAAQVFQKMDSAALSGIGIVDTAGKLVGATMAKDIKKLVSAKNYDTLKTPILEFLHSIRKTSTSSDNKQATEEQKSKLVVTIAKSATLRDAITLLGANSEHRLFIVEAGKPVGVVSIIDILRVCCM